MGAQVVNIDVKLPTLNINMYIQIVSRAIDNMLFLWIYSLYLCYKLVFIVNSSDGAQPEICVTVEIKVAPKTQLRSELLELKLIFINARQGLLKLI